MRAENAKSVRRAIVLGALAFHALGVLMIAFTTSYPAPVDELAHLSYAVHAAEAGGLFGDFAAMRLWDHAAGTFGEQHNYLGHPSPYYLLMGGLAELLKAWTGAGDATVVTVLRLTNALISLAGVALVLEGGTRVLPGTAERLLFAGTAILFPKLAVLGGLINNDNLAFLAAGLVFFGLCHERGHAGRLGLSCLILGIVIAGWTKLTTLLMVTLAVGFSELFAIWTAGRLRLDLRHLALFAAGVVAAVPYLHNWLTFGELVYTSRQFFEALVAERGRPDLDLLGYTQRFGQLFFYKWSALEPASVVQMAGFAAVIGLIALGTAQAWRARQSAMQTSDPSAFIAIGYVLATLVVIPIHFYFGWSHFQDTGHLIGSYSRYYYALWPGLALAVALARPALGTIGITAKLPGLRSPGVWVLTHMLLLSAGIQFIFIFQGLGSLIAALT